MPKGPIDLAHTLMPSVFSMCFDRFCSCSSSQAASESLDVTIRALLEHQK